ncbi:MAG TPA: hypothetical protein VGA87_05435, partial [Pyrinomonadaceae bacterium]
MKRNFNLHARAASRGALLLFALVALVAGAHAQKGPGAKHSDLKKAETQSDTPRFSDYPVREVYKG